MQQIADSYLIDTFQHWARSQPVGGIVQVQRIQQTTLNGHTGRQNDTRLWQETQYYVVSLVTQYAQTIL